MKKYQLWLQRKSYSQHLNNLMKIKYSHAKTDKKQRLSTPKHNSSHHNENHMMSRYKQMEDFHQEQSNIGDVSYAITFKQLKNHKMRLMRTFDIMNQNMSIARRLKEVKSVFHQQKQKQHATNYVRRKHREKKCQHSNQSLRNQNYSVFRRWHNRRINYAVHKYVLEVTIDQFFILPMRGHHDFRDVWCEVLTDKGSVRSEMSEISTLEPYRFTFPLQQQLPPHTTLKLYTCNGLNSQQIGEFSFESPQPESILEKELRSEKSHLEIQAWVSYQKISKSKPNLTLK